MNYIITGAGFNNKGAESMFYAVAAEIKSKDENAQITFISLSEFDKKKEKLLNNIKLLKEDSKQRKHLASPYYHIADKITNIFKKNENLEIWYQEFKKADIIIDISGFALTSKWGKKANQRIINNIKLAKIFNKKIVLMPQSFGPFDYKKEDKITKKDITKWLNKADLIFCREKDGYNQLKDLGIKNIILSYYLVLQNKNSYENIILDNKEKNININIKENSILILPSTRILERTDEKAYFNLYKREIQSLLDKNFNIYLSYYAKSDLQVCKKLKDMFNDNIKVTLISDDLNCIQFQKILPKFKFLITSRYHSIVHSYKQFIPCIVIGWAIKYKELMHNLNQDKYLFDCKNEISNEEFENKVNELIKNLENEREIIKNKMNDILETSCFDTLWKYIEDWRTT